MSWFQLLYGLIQAFLIVVYNCNLRTYRQADLQFSLLVFVPYLANKQLAYLPFSTFILAIAKASSVISMVERFNLPASFNSMAY